MFEFIEGERPTQATPDLVRQALAFFSDLNGGRSLPYAAALPVASEACFSLREHVETVERRIQRFAAIPEDTDIDRDAAAFVSRELDPAWRELARSIESRVSTEDFSRPLTPEQRCISPSDFGFHNAILAADGRLRFFDFEYAGWDDPAKTICDFFCQPAVPVPRSLFDEFETQIRTRVTPTHSSRMLLPLCQIKWCCIMLNEFLPADQSRRAFSDPHADHHARKKNQLAQARHALGEFQERD